MSETVELLEILKYPHPFLGKKCRPLTESELKSGTVKLSARESFFGKPTEWNLLQLARRMVATMYANKGIGLAAAQVGIGLRFFVFDISNDKSGVDVLYNPVLTQKHGTILEEEGCLSLPSVRAKVKRFAELHVAGVNARGEHVEADVSELLARVCQHETDHLDGVLFINKLGMTGRLVVRKQLMELEDDYELQQKRTGAAV